LNPAPDGIRLAAAGDGWQVKSDGFGAGSAVLLISRWRPRIQFGPTLLIQEQPNMSASETCQSFQRIAANPVFAGFKTQVASLESASRSRSIVAADRTLRSKLVPLVLSAELPSGRQFLRGNLTGSLCFPFSLSPQLCSLRLCGLTVSFSTLRA